MGSSFSRVSVSYSESWPVEQPPVVAYIHLDPSLPRKAHYPPCSLPGSFCWSVNATCSTPCRLWELSPQEENGEEEGRGRRRSSFSFFLALFLRESLTLAPISNLGAQHETVPVEEVSSLSIVQKFCHFTDVWKNTHTLPADILLSFICWAPPNSHYMVLLCHPNVNKRDCCSSELKHYSCLASATGDSLWINEMSAEMSRLYPLDLSKRKNNHHGGIDIT